MHGARVLRIHRRGGRCGMPLVSPGWFRGRSCRLRAARVAPAHQGGGRRGRGSLGSLRVRGTDRRETRRRSGRGAAGQEESCQYGTCDPGLHESSPFVERRRMDSAAITAPAHGRYQKPGAAEAARALPRLRSSGLTARTAVGSGRCVAAGSQGRGCGSRRPDHGPRGQPTSSAPERARPSPRRTPRPGPPRRRTSTLRPSAEVRTRPGRSGRRSRRATRSFRRMHKGLRQRSRRRSRAAGRRRASSGTSRRLSG